jgi:hypothetical protein
VQERYYFSPQMVLSMGFEAMASPTDKANGIIDLLYVV